MSPITQHANILSRQSNDLGVAREDDQRSEATQTPQTGRITRVPPSALRGPCSKKRTPIHDLEPQAAGNITPLLAKTVPTQYNAKACSTEALEQSHRQFLALQRPFKLPAQYAWFDVHAEFIFQAMVERSSLDPTDFANLEAFTESLRTAALYAFGLLDRATVPLIKAASSSASNTKESGASQTLIERLQTVGKNPERLIGDLLGLQLLHEDGLLTELEFDNPQDFRRFARIYTLAKHLHAHVDPEDDYTRLTDAYHPKNVIAHLTDKSNIALLTAATFHDFERYVPGIRVQKLPCAKLDETIRKQAMHPLNSATLALHLLRLSPLTTDERQRVFDLIRNHDAGPDGLTVAGYEYVPHLTGTLREQLIDLCNADTAAFFDFSPMQDPTVEVFVKDRVSSLLEKMANRLTPTGETLTHTSKDQIANLALTQQAAGIKPLQLDKALTNEDKHRISDISLLNTAMQAELDKLEARITKHAKRISPEMLGTVAVLHAQRPRTKVDALIHSALKKYDKMNSNLKSLKSVALTVMATQRLSRAHYQKKRAAAPDETASNSD